MAKTADIRMKDMDSPRYQRAVRFANGVYGLLRDFLPSDRDCYHRIYDYLFSLAALPYFSRLALEGFNEGRSPRSESFKASDLRLVKPAPPPDDPPLEIGDRCRLNSGGPLSLVVDCNPERVVVAWRDQNGGTSECGFPRACVRRVSENPSSE